MKYLAMVLCFLFFFCGCEKQSILYNKVFTPNFDIVSFEEIDPAQKKMAEEMFNRAMIFLKQERLNGRFTIRIFYNDIAFDTYYRNKSGESIFTHSVLANYNLKHKEIAFPVKNMNRDTIGHEMIHAITHINRLKKSDSESVAYKFGDTIKEVSL